MFRRVAFVACVLAFGGCQQSGVPPRGFRPGETVVVYKPGANYVFGWIIEDEGRMRDSTAIPTGERVVWLDGGHPVWKDSDEGYARVRLPDGRAVFVLPTELIPVPR